MGTKRIGLARFEALLENLKRALALGTATISAASVEATTGGLIATAGGLLVTAGRIRSHLDHTSINAQSHTLTAEQTYKGLITITSVTGGGDITTPTSAQIIAGHSGLGALTAIGQTIICHVSNDGNQTLSVVKGADVLGDVTRTCAAMTSLTLVFKRTALAVVTVYVM